MIAAMKACLSGAMARPTTDLSIATGTKMNPMTALVRIVLSCTALGGMTTAARKRKVTFVNDQKARPYIFT